MQIILWLSFTLLCLSLHVTMLCCFLRLFCYWKLSWFHILRRFFWFSCYICILYRSCIRFGPAKLSFFFFDLLNIIIHRLLFFTFLFKPCTSSLILSITQIIPMIKFHLFDRLTFTLFLFSRVLNFILGMLVLCLVFALLLKRYLRVWRWETCFRRHYLSRFAWWMLVLDLCIMNHWRLCLILNLDCF